MAPLVPMAMQRYYQQTGEYISLERLMMHIWLNPLKDGRRFPLLIWGGSGIGKTQQIKAFAREHGFQIMTYHPSHDTSGADIAGEKMIDPVTRRTTYAIPSFLPNEETDQPGILFVDELNRATEIVLAGLMEMFGEGEISQSGWKLPKNWMIVAAANPSELGYQVNELDQAMVDRMLHYAPGWDGPGWAKWAESKDFNPQVIDFAMANPEIIETGEAQLPLEIDNKLSATPRSLEYFDSLYSPDLSEGMLKVIAEGILGRNAANAFIRQHVGESALTFEMIASLTGYEDTLQRWIHAGDLSLITASSKRVVAGLQGRPVEKELSRIIGKYIALLPKDYRDDVWRLLDRSAVEWLAPLRQTTAKWRQHLAKSGKLLTD